MPVFAKLSILTTTTNIEWLVQEIGGENVEVFSFTKGKQDPHFLEAKPSFTLKASRADLIISVGKELEVGWLPLVIRGSRNPKVRYGQSGHLRLGDYVTDTLEVVKEVTRSDGDVHPEGNPHFMLSPKRVIRLVDVIVTKLVSLDSKNQKTYRVNGKKVVDEIKKIHSLIMKMNINGRKVVTYHKTLSYFFDDYGISVEAYIEPKPGIPPSTGHIVKVLKTIEEKNIKKIIVENLFDEKAGRKIVNGTKGATLEVLPVFVKGVSNIKSLPELYLRIARSLE